MPSLAVSSADSREAPFFTEKDISVESTYLEAMVPFSWKIERFLMIKDIFKLLSARGHTLEGLRAMGGYFPRRNSPPPATLELSE